MEQQNKNQQNKGANSNPIDEKNSVDNSLEERAKKVGVPFLKKAPSDIRDEILKIIPEKTARNFNIAAFDTSGDKGIKVAMLDPQDIQALDVLRFIAEKKEKEINIYLASKEVVKEIIERYNTAEEAVEAVVESFESERNKDRETFLGKKIIDEHQKNIQDAPVSKLVSVVIKHAIEGRASDIHLEPTDNGYRVRFRVDGILYASLVLPGEVGKAFVSRIKILSNLKIDEKRKPQDGRFNITEGGENIDFRVSTFPVVGGEKVVMRVLTKDKGIFDFVNLGLMGHNKEILTRKIEEPNGIILITGPTGSGKSTTLYSFLNIINQETRNIVTLEDPVEYSIEGVNQSQIRPEIGYDFANGLRSILRQDPNVIMVGEIRDSETAELSIHAALTGHLVFSTLHTNSAAGAMPRLADMGIEPFLLASSLKAVAAQRLVRRICPVCKEEVTISEKIKKRIMESISNVSEKELKEYDLDLSKGIKFYKGKGCEECGGTGLKGRLAIYECIEVNENVQEAINEGRELKNSELAVSQGMITMKQDGILKALKGMTVLSEVERVTEGSLTIGGDVDDDRG
ncbi:MAG: GspE/PulE family protein [Candidatus Moranbacteria bacterium]|jgi:type IV pilus assembly protein PilB|nr:GspE/PulE family protein [Candidatus Moranbacteria bacterium]